MTSAIDTPKYVVSPAVPPLVTLALVVVLDRAFPVPFLPHTVSLVIGIPLFALGVGLWVWGVSGLVRGGESPNPGKTTTHLVTNGPYRLSRNPIYAGGTTGLLGLALLLNTATGAIVVVGLALLAHNLILAEERYLDAKFGDEWREYCQAVRRWL